MRSILLGKKRKYFPLVLSSCFLMLLIISSMVSCGLYLFDKKLSPEDEKFLSRVRYIITGKERKIFRELPDKDRDDFKQEFWDRRDPDPYTEENEFKTKYFDRIERANQLFISEGKPGWLTDRGRIYILFGPPTDRITGSMDIYFYGGCREVWYYYNFPVAFEDRTCTGDYKLVTYNLSGIRSLNLRYMSELAKAQEESQNTIQKEEDLFFDFNWNVRTKLVDKQKLEAVVLIEVPYSNIWFKEKEEMLETILDLHLELRNSLDKIVWEYDNVYSIKGSEQEIEQKIGEKYLIEVLFAVEKDLQSLGKGKNRLLVALKNRTSGDERKKVTEFKLRFN